MSNYSNQQVKQKAVLAFHGGMPVAQVANAYQVHRATLYRWISRHAANSSDGLSRKPGSGRPRIIEQIDTPFLSDIVMTSALDYGYETDLWTCKRIQNVIEDTSNQSISKWTVWRRLRESGLTYQKPEKKYMEVSEEDRKYWRRYTAPKIRKAVKSYKAILYFQDESNISLTAFLGKTWAPKGETPRQEVTGKRGGVAAMSAISGIGSLIFKLHQKRIASDEVIDFLKQMLEHHPRRHLVVVMDQASPHTSKKAKEFIANQKRLHVFYLPKYSPDWNPDEKVWNHLKTQELKSHRAKNKDELYRLANEKLSGMANSPSILRGIFFRCCVAEFLH